MRYLLNFLSIACCTASFFAALWILIPAPTNFLWLFAVAASEWSLWIGMLALAGIIFSLAIIISNGFSTLPIVSGIAGFIALSVSLYPLLSVLSLAKENDVNLSIARYFAATLSLESSRHIISLSTYTYFESEGKRLDVNVYLPASETSNRGAGVIIVHGGSWNGGVRNDFPQWNTLLAEQGFTIFDIDYSLSPQPNYLTATGDVKCAVRWVKTNASKFNIDPSRIAVMGRSAGAHLALLAAYSAGNEHLPSSCASNTNDETVSAVVSFYAPINLLWAYDNPANPMVINGPLTLANFLGGSPHESDEIRSRFILASPITHVSTQTPPTLLVHGGRDQLVRLENMQFLDIKLTEANVPHQTLMLPYAQHGFDYNLNGWNSQIAGAMMLEFLSEHTRTK